MFWLLFTGETTQVNINNLKLIIMKKFLFLAVLLLMILGACQKEEISPVESPYFTGEVDEQTSSNLDLIDPSVQDSVSESSDSVVLKASGMTEYQVNPKFGKPNSSYYYFKVYAPYSSLALSVKLYNRATGAVTYLTMVKSANYWVTSTKISANGWYDYRYVYTINKNPISSTASYELCNSKNSFSYYGTSSISWPFGADGSSWYNRRTWNGGQEGGSGYGWNEGTHTGTSERYSDDWNKTNDLGAIIRSPLDGYIETIGKYYVSGYGYSKYVSIIQKGPDGKFYRFYVSHLQSTASGLYSGKYVRAGIDQIGTLGSTGASSPHAHTNMRVNGASVKFYFNAQ